MSISYHDGSGHFDILQNILVASSRAGEHLFVTSIAQNGVDLNFQKPCDAVLGLLPSPYDNHLSAITRSHLHHRPSSINRISIDFKKDELILNGPRPKFTLVSVQCPPQTMKLKIPCTMIKVYLDRPGPDNIITYENMPVMLDTGTTYSLSWLRPDYSLYNECVDSNIVRGITLFVQGQEIHLLFDTPSLYPPCVPRDIKRFKPAFLLLGIQALEQLPRGISYGISENGGQISDIQLL